MGFSRVSVIIAVSHRDINVERASSAGKYRELYDFCEANRAAPGPSFWAHARPERYPRYTSFHRTVSSQIIRTCPSGIEGRKICIFLTRSLLLLIKFRTRPTSP